MEYLLCILPFLVMSWSKIYAHSLPKPYNLIICYHAALHGFHRSSHDAKTGRTALNLLMKATETIVFSTLNYF